MTRLTFADYLDRAMKRMHTDSRKLESDTGVPASWTRNLKSGRIKGAPDEDRLAKIVAALQLDAVEVWKYLGRFDKVAELRGEPLRGEQEPQPEWAIRLESKIDALSDLLRSVGNRVDGGVDGVASVLAMLSQANGPRPGDRPAGPAAPRRPARRRRAPRKNEGTK